MPNVLKRYVEDDWNIPFSYRSSTGAGINLTGFLPKAELFLSDRTDPILLTVANGGVFLLNQNVPDNHGKFRLVVDKLVTKNFKPDPEAKASSLTISMIDPDGEQQTLGKISLKIESRR